MRPPFISLLTATLALTLLSTMGCQEHVHRLGEPSLPHDDTRAWAESLRGEFHTPLTTHVEQATGEALFASLLAKKEKLTWRKRIAKGVKYADLFKRAYAQHHHTKFLTTYKGLSPKGLAALARLKAADTHHIEEPMDYHVEAIEALHTKLKALQKNAQPISPIYLAPDELEALITYAKEQELVPGENASKQALTTYMLEAPADNHPAPRIADTLDALRAQVSKTAQLQAELELLMADGMLRYARDMKFFNLNRMSWKELKDAGGSKKVIYARLEAFWTQMKDAPEAQVEQILDSLSPLHPDYHHLVAMRQRYIAHLDNWPRVTPMTFKDTSKHAPKLRRRLMIEGYLPETLTPAQINDTRVDEQLVGAVKAFHDLRGLPFKGRAHSKFWKALRADPKKRLRLIELNLERRRASRYEGEEDFVFVNLPDFHAEIYESKKRAMRFKVVIGKNNRKCDPKTNRFVYPNATPELASTMKHFILNPSWYVPERIIEEEIKPNVEKDEAWLEQNHYEIVKKRGEKWIVRQTPGPHNALGLVKFIFPNPHNTYMHDTARKEFFDYERRAYSHGCMRVHEPLKLAEYLVKFDNQQADINVQEIVDSTQSKMVKLKRELPVFVEYYTIQFSPEGYPRVLPDIYRHDKRDLSKNPKSYGRCNGAAVLKKEAGEALPAGSARDLGP